MFYSQTTLGKIIRFFPFAFRKLIPRIFRNVVALVLSCVTWLTEMRGTPTEPLRYRAAELAFILDEVGSVSFANLFTATFGHCSARSTYELFPLEIDGSLVGSLAVFHATEVGVLALEAHVVR